MSEYNYRELGGIGNDVYISANVEIKRPKLLLVGNHIAIDSYFYCTTNLQIGDYCHIAPFVLVIGGKDGLLKIGNFCTIAAGSRIICASDKMLSFAKELGYDILGK